MSSVAFISDIHGNFPALRSSLERIDTLGVEKVVCLGDIVGFYSMINECIEILQKRKIFCLKGNHDHAAAFAGGVISRSKTCTRVLKQQLSEIKPEYLNWLKGLNSKAEFDFSFGHTTLVHGGLEDPVDEYLFDIPMDYFESRKLNSTYFLYGHTHLPRMAKFRGVTAVNPGSVGQPRDKDPRSSFCIIGDDGVRFFRVEYDFNEIEQDMRNKGYEAYIYEILRKGTKIE